LGNRESQDDKIPSIMWEKYKTGKGAESKERKESSDTRRRKGSKMGGGG